MTWNSGKSNKKMNIILAIVSIVLILVLGMVLVTDHRSTGKETKELTELTDKEKKVLKIMKM